MSVCGTDRFIHKLGSFSGQLDSQEFNQKVVSFAHRPKPGRLDGYNHESAPTIMPRTSKQYKTSTGILTRCPSPTLLASA